MSITSENETRQNIKFIISEFPWEFSRNLKKNKVNFKINLWKWLKKIIDELKI
jgi:hypothetical protein